MGDHFKNVPCLDLVLFVILLMGVCDQRLVSRRVLFGVSKRLQFTYKNKTKKTSGTCLSTDAIFQEAEKLRSGFVPV